MSTPRTRLLSKAAYEKCTFNSPGRRSRKSTRDVMKSYWAGVCSWLPLSPYLRDPRANLRHCEKVAGAAAVGTHSGENG